MYSSAYVWGKIIAYLEKELSAPVIEPWFMDTEVLEYTDTHITLYVPTQFQKETILKRAMPHIKQAMKSIFGMDIEVKVLAETEIQNFKRGNKSMEFLEFNPQFTFEKFVVGSSNQFAHAAAIAVADNPGTSRNYNPLVIYSPPGLGKTHLLYAIASRVHKKYPEKSIIYIRGEQFMNELITSIQSGNMPLFREKYRQADLLLVDDIQFIAGKGSTEEEFFHTFNALYESNKQIVMASDRPPHELKQLEERLITRFEWGIVTEICPPDFENRIAILHNKAMENGIDLPDDVAKFLAENITSDVRKLEGALKMLIASSKLDNKPITQELAGRILKNIKADARSTPNADLILTEVCRFYSIDMQTLRSKQKTKVVNEARQVAMYLLQTMANFSTPDIGKELERDHTTVLHGCNKIKSLLEDRNSGMVDNIRDIKTSILSKL